jgi:hypothetical protein
VLTAYQAFGTMVHTEYDSSIHIFRPDYTGEYLSRPLHHFLYEQGTLPQYTCTGAHAQNGVADCKHCHLLEIARALLLASSVPPKFWAEVVSTIVYLVNILPSTALHGVTPLERLTSRPPQHSQLCSFGCVSFVLCHSQSKVFSLVMTLSIRDIVVGIWLLIAFGFPVILPSMSLVLSSPMFTPLMSQLIF